MGVPGATPAPRLGPYEIEKRLGSGGMAEVFLARRTGPFGFKKRVAIKRILPGHENDPRFLQMFCDEARVAARLSHANIAQVVDFGEHDGQLFLVMEYVDGVSCSKVLRTVAKQGSTVPLGQALYIAREILQALAFAHDATDEEGRPLNVVHRDVSPSNVLVSRTGEVKLIDFGVTLSRLNARYTMPGELKGKLRYMSPEQVVGGTVDHRSDLFAVGIVLGEMLLGRSLFGSRTELETLTRICRGDLSPVWDGNLGRDVRDMLLAALAHRPEDRFQSAADFARLLGDLARDAGVVLDGAALAVWLQSIGVISSMSGTRLRAASLSDERPSARPTLVSLPPTAVPGPRPKIPSSTLDTPGRRKLRSERRRKDSLTPTAVSLPPAIEQRAARLPPPPSSQFGSGAYRLRTVTGVVGPLSRPQMLEMLATGRLTPASQVSLDGERYFPLAQVPALAPMAQRRPYQFRTLPAEPEWRHPVERPILPRMLYMLAAQRRTGLLVLHDGNRQKRVYFNNGDPVFTSSTQRDELLGVRLIAAGAVNESLVELALRQQPPMRLGEALVTLGALQAAQLVRELASQLEDRVVDLGSWSSGEACFIPGAAPGENTVQAPTATLQLITRLVKSHFDPAEIAGILRPLADLPLGRAPKYRSLSTLIGLTTEEYAALEQASSAASIQALANGLGRQGVATWADTLRAVFIGLSAGLLRTAGWPEACTRGPSLSDP